MQKDGSIIVTDLRSGKPAVHIDLCRVRKSKEDYQPGDSFEMMYYSDEILALHVTNQARNDSFLRFIWTTARTRDSERTIGCVPLEINSSKLFVRHTVQHVCFGTHTGEGSDGHRKWVIQCHTMDFNEDATNKKLLLEDFHGNDLGSTVAFEIHDGYFHAVSNQGTYEVEEIDWTSFYHCVRFSLQNPCEEAMEKNTRVYRRQHAEGAIHDSWTNLTLRHDEQTNDLFIVESRREWLGASSQQARTFYTSRISFSSPAFADSSWDMANSNNDIASPLPLPENDILTTVLESAHSANYMPTPRQYSWTRHPEFPFTQYARSTPRSFILARTKFRTYNFSCSAFLDLVEDEQCCSNRLPVSLPCLKLRIGSRRIAPYGYNPYSYEDRPAAAKYSLTSDSPKGQRVNFEDKTQYRYTPIRMWPPPPSKCPCSARLHRIMNPDIRPNTGIGSGQKTVTAICDERSIVYMIKPSRTYSYESVNGDGIDSKLGTIVLIDFGRSPTPAASPATTNPDLCWTWAPGQEKRCNSGTCR